MTREEVKKVVEQAMDRRGRLHFTVPFPDKIHPSSLKFILQRLYVVKQSNEIQGYGMDRAKAVGGIDTNINKKKVQEIGRILMGDHTGRAILKAFYSKGAAPFAWTFFLQQCRTVQYGRNWRRNYVSYNDGLVKFLVDLFHDAVGLGNKTLEVKYRTGDVMNLIKGIRKTSDFTVMPILADALMDAGFSEVEILNHYRNPAAQFSFGSWIFRASGITRKVTEAKVPQEVAV